MATPAARRCAPWIIKTEQALALVSVGERDDDVSVRLKAQTHSKSATSFTYGPGCGCGLFNTKTLITMRIYQTLFLILPSHKKWYNDYE